MFRLDLGQINKPDTRITNPKPTDNTAHCQDPNFKHNTPAKLKQYDLNRNKSPITIKMTSQ